MLLMMHLKIFISIVSNRRFDDGRFRSCFNAIGYYKLYTSFIYSYFAP